MKLRLALTAALAVAVLPVGAVAAAGDPDCDDTVADAIHELEEATGLTALHEVEEAYCGLA
jgi:hypothetical protein